VIILVKNPYISFQKCQVNLNITDDEDILPQLSTKSKSSNCSSKSLSKIKLEYFTPTSKRIMKSAYAFTRVQLATVDAFPADRGTFTQECLKAYSHLASTSPEFFQHLQVVDGEDKESYTAYVSLNIYFKFILS
jgi:hypothetical protein